MHSDSFRSEPAYLKKQRRQAFAGATLVLAAALVALYMRWKVDRPDSSHEPSPAVASPQRAAPAAADSQQPVPTLRQSARSERLASPARHPPTAGAHGIYKCRKDGRVVYADRPCDGDTEVLLLPVPSAGLAPDRSYAEQLDRLRADRAGTRPAAQAQESAATRSDSSNDTPCATIDREIQQIDATTRQPLSVPMAEHYRERRRALMDQRFSAGCNG